MIPLFLVLGFCTSRQRIFKLWLPLFLIWLLLLPLVLVLLPFTVIALLALRMSPWRTIADGWQLLASLSGTHVEVRDPDHYVLIRII